MPRYLIPFYGAAIGYAALAYLAREDGIILIEVIGFGLPALLWWAFEWFAPPAIAAFAGFQARQSIPSAAFAAPLVVLVAVITPTVRGTNVVIPGPIPWLAAFPFSLNQALPIIQERLVLWGSVFLLAVIVGRIIRLTHRSSGT